MINSFQIGQLFQQDFVINQNIQDHFIQLSKDRNPMQTDEFYSNQYGFEGRVMHGNILNAFLSYVIGECLPIKNVVIQSQSIEYKNPIYINTQIKFEMLVDSVVESVNVVIFKFKFLSLEGKVFAKGKIQIGIL
jgi:acyl dehydratase